MDPRCLDNQLREAERIQFRDRGYLMLENVLEPDHVADLVDIVDRVDGEERARLGHGPRDRINHFDFIGKDAAFLELLDHCRTFPKVWGLLGWHIQLYHSHMTCTPPEPVGRSLEKDGLGLGWHQDSGQLNRDLESEPRPMISVKVAFFLTDTSIPGRGNFFVLPGSQQHYDFPRLRSQKTRGRRGSGSCAGGIGGGFVIAVSGTRRVQITGTSHDASFSTVIHTAGFVRGTT